MEKQGEPSKIDIDQKIEERESLRHSTHRSQRSDRAQGIAGGIQNQANTTQQMSNPMHQTASDKFGATDYNMSENQDRPNFQKNQSQMEDEQERQR